MTPYATPLAFKQALETRIRNAAAKTGSDIGRFRQVLVFDRFLARVHQRFGTRVVVKGGVVLELRLQQARATRDVDLRIVGNADGLLDAFRAAGQLDLGDWLSFEVSEDPDHPVMQGDGMVYGGYRFRAEAKLAGKVYASPFGVDVGFADKMTEEPELIAGTRFLSFVGVEPAQLRIYPRSTHLAEKLHAYTLPRERENTRVKDLPDIALLSMVAPLSARKLHTAISETFAFRATHEVPSVLPAPPASWDAPYERMARANRLPWKTLSELTQVVEQFLNPLLAGTTATWNPEGRTWE